jgi:hypothetical protein
MEFKGGLIKPNSPSEIASNGHTLKDACNPVYGSRGAAGVTIVSTKKIKRRTSVEYSVTAIDYIPKKTRALNADEWWQ